MFLHAGLTTGMEQTRRSVLAGTAAGTTALVAGCLGGSDTDPAVVGAGDGDDELAPPTIGDGEVGVAVFSDFSCGACRLFNDEIKPQLIEEYVETDTIRIVHRDLILDTFEWSRPVANAAWAIKDTQDDAAFWAFIDAMYPRQEEYSNEVIETVAEETAGLGEQARDAAEAGTYDDRIDADGALYDAIAGRRQTPAVFVDGNRVEVEEIAGAIESAR